MRNPAAEVRINRHNLPQPDISRAICECRGRRCSRRSALAKLLMQTSLTEHRLNQAEKQCISA